MALLAALACVGAAIAGAGRRTASNAIDDAAWPGNDSSAELWTAATGFGDGDGAVMEYEQFHVVAGDFDGDGRMDVATLSATAGGPFEYAVSMELSTGAGVTSAIWAADTPRHLRGGGAGSDYRVLAADVDGDGRDDLVTIGVDAWSGDPAAPQGWGAWIAVERSTGSGFESQRWPAALPARLRAGGPSADYRVLVADVDGDGRDDLVAVSPDAADPGGAAATGWATGVAVERSTGRGFDSGWWPATTASHLRGGGAGADYRVLVADVDGDGRHDLVTVSPDAWSADGSHPAGWGAWAAVERSTGNGFESQQWPMATAAHMRNAGPDRTYFVRVGDFDGDGRADLATISPDAWSADGRHPEGFGAWVAMELSTGTGFRSELWPAATPAHLRNGGVDRTWEVVVGDLDGDGRDDLATISVDGWSNDPADPQGWGAWIAVERSTGNGFESQRWPAATPRRLREGGADRRYRSIAGDVDGDGNADLVTVSDDGRGRWDGGIAVERSSGTGFTSDWWPAATPRLQRRWGAQPLAAATTLPPPCPGAPKPDDHYQFQFDRCDDKRYPSNHDREWACPAIAPRATASKRDGTPLTYRPVTASVVVDSRALAGLVPANVDVAVIDIVRVDGVPHVRHLSNGTHANPVQPFSTSKFIAIANAGAALRARSGGAVGLTGSVDGYRLGDLITVAHNYVETTFTSNGLGRFFLDLGGRRRADDLLRSWLGDVSTAGESLGGSYGDPVPPLGATIVEPSGASVAVVPERGPERRNALSMLTLAEALERLVLHREVPSRRLPFLTWADVQTLLYGAADPSAWGAWGGMTADRATYLQAAVDLDEVERRSGGRWRIFSKLGGGDYGEFVQVGYACFPVLDGAGRPVPGLGREFVLAANHSRPGAVDDHERDRYLAEVIHTIVDALLDRRV